MTGVATDVQPVAVGAQSLTQQRDRATGQMPCQIDATSTPRCRPHHIVEMLPPAALDQWQALTVALRDRGPATCGGGEVLPIDSWWSTNPVDQALAVDACTLCPVMVACLEYALAANEPEGIWGGLTSAERASAVAA